MSSLALGPRCGNRVVLACVLAGLGAPAAAQFGGFEWTLAGNPTGSGSAAPTGLHVVGPDAFGCDLGNTTHFETVLPASGFVSVDVDFVNLDSWVAQGHAIFDSPALLLDGVLHQPPDGGCCGIGWMSGPYHLDVEVDAGQVLGLGVWAADCLEGPGIADFTNLVFVPLEHDLIPAAIDLRQRLQVDDLADGSAGLRIATLGDADGDGGADVAVLAALAEPPLLAIVAASDGSTLLAVGGPFAEATRMASAGFFDLDAVPDIVLGMPAITVQGKVKAGRCEVRSGANGALLFALEGGANHGQLGVSVAGLGDVDGDGRDDIAVGEQPTFFKKTKVRILGGPDGHLIASFQSPLTFGSYGTMVAGCGDVDADGVPDVAIGEPAEASADPDTVHVHSGATQAELHTLTGAGQFGVAIEGAGDIDGDGHDDVFVGAPGAGTLEEGLVTLVSGATGGTLLTVSGGKAGAAIGGRVAAGSDMTGDGSPDFATPSAGSLLVFDSLTGALEATVAPTDSSYLAASGLDSLPDVNGDGLVDLVSSPSGPGRVLVLHNLDRGPPPNLLVTGSPVASGPISIAMEGLLPAAPLLLVAGASKLSEPFKGGVLVPFPQLLLPLVADGQGKLAIDLTWPAGLPQWSTIWLQAWGPDADAWLGWWATDAAVLTQIGP